jgi:steroid delta-isomerase
MTDPNTFVREWIAAWSRRDVDAVLAHYAESAVFTSPKAEKFVGRARLEGKAALADYWRTAVAKLATIHFELDHFAWDAEKRTIAICYVANLAGARARACEVMRFGDDGLVVSGEAFYGAG